MAVARGGWIPTRLLSTHLAVKNIVSIGIKYADATRTKLTTYSLPQVPDGVKNILLVEDMLESGNSLKWASEFYKENGYSVKTVACYVTPKTSFIVDYFLRKVPLDTKFPWEG